MRRQIGQSREALSLLPDLNEDGRLVKRQWSTLEARRRLQRVSRILENLTNDANEGVAEDLRNAVRLAATNHGLATVVAEIWARPSVLIALKWKVDLFADEVLEAGLTVERFLELLPRIVCAAAVVDGED
jgi:hypothetical protein